MKLIEWMKIEKWPLIVSLTAMHVTVSEVLSHLCKILTLIIVKYSCGKGPVKLIEWVKIEKWPLSVSLTAKHVTVNEVLSHLCKILILYL